MFTRTKSSKILRTAFMYIELQFQNEDFNQRINF